ncbi:uncharacterized protein VTP21DRAFT_6634 [Calcarisporiella thermophila]|uniref:uncharacterized protein n=1 Tax=Calcarisporiella thermophila TaxID=911321 RepID=UPI003743754B
MTTQVLIIGSGPVGLYLAYELARYNVSFRIIEKLETRSPLSRAFGIVPRTLEAFDHSGIVEPIIKQGTYLKAFTFNAGTKTLFRFDTFGGLPHSTFPAALTLSQARTEAIIADELKKNFGKDIEYGKELIGYESLEDKIVATVRVKRGEEVVEEVIEAEYMVGCDGAHSTVRKLDKDWKFSGVSIEGIFLLADLVFEESCPFPDNEVTVFTTIQDGVRAFFPLLDRPRHFRLVSTMSQSVSFTKSDVVTHGLNEDNRRNNKQPLPTFTVENIQADLDKYLPDLKLRIAEATWNTTFKVNERKVDKYKRGRVFLCGDAAHCHSPAGGQGLNMGVQDAHNLAFKLSLVLNGQASSPSRVLDSYEVERSPVAEKTIRITGAMTRFVIGVGNSPIATAFRLLMPLLPVSYMRDTMRNTIFQLTARYAESPLLQKRALSSTLSWIFGRNGDANLITPGTHLPDAFLKLPVPAVGKDTCTLYDALRGSTQHTAILFVSNNGITPQHNPKGISSLRLITSRFNSSIQPLIIAFGNSFHCSHVENPALEGIPVLAETRRELHEKIGVSSGQQAIVVVRPDLYIAAVGYVPFGVDEVIAHMGMYLKVEESQ